MKKIGVEPTLCALVLSAIVLAVFAGAVPGAWAEDAQPSDVATADAEEFLGIWLLKMDFMGRDIEFYLRVVDVDGQLGATLDSQQQPEAQSVAGIALTDEGLTFAYQMSFGGGGQGITMDIKAKRVGDELTGTIRERSSGLIDAPFTGVIQSEDELDLIQGKRPNPTDTKLRLAGDKMIRIAFSDLEVGTEDHARFSEVKDGEIFKFTSGRATKMYTDVNLSFGDTVIEKENVAKDYPGVYSLWLKRVGDGWNLVFNGQPDIWGTRHDPEFDVAEVPLTVTVSEEEVDVLVMKIEETDETSGIIQLAWGPQVWTVEFSMPQQ